MKPVTIDFETQSIANHPRPGSPPPVGLAIHFPGCPPEYLAWGHPAGTNGRYILVGKRLTQKKCDDPRDLAKRMLKDAYGSRGGVLGHNVAKFDLPVASDWFKIDMLDWSRVHDTLFSLFLDDPHATSLSLKPASERLLSMKPEERDEVYDWLAEHGVIARPQTRKGVLTYPKDAGGHIAEAPGQIVAKYAIGDLTRTEGLHDLLYPKICALGMKAPYDRERELAPLLLANERRGMRVDMEGLERDLPIYERALEKSGAWLRRALKASGLNLDADKDVAAALKKSGVVTRFPKTPTGRDSVSKKVLTIDLFNDKKVFHALYYRNALATVLTMSMRKWLEEGSKKKGYVFTEWNQVRQGHGNDQFKGARSGRITCSYFQNISKTFLDRGDGFEHPGFLGVPELPLVRRYLLPDPGDLFGHIDYNQQEMRLVAHYEDGALAQAYRTNPATDIHIDVQQMIKKASGKLYERRPVKIVDFRTVYGGGASGLAEQLHISLAQAKQIIGDWKLALPDVVDLDRQLKEKFRSGDHLRTFGGRVYRCKPPAVAKKGPRKGQLITFEYTALNYLIQPSGADVTKEAIIRWHKARKVGRMVVAVHDEINLSVPKGKEGLAEMRRLKECMESIKLDVPWQSDTKMGDCWGDLKKLEAK